MKTLVVAGSLSLVVMFILGSQADSAVHKGDILVADSDALDGNGALIAVNPQTGVQSIVSSGGYFSHPWGITIDNDGSVLITDRGTKKILRVDPSNGNQTIISQDGWVSPMDVVVNASGQLFVGSSGNCVPGS